MSIRSSLPDVSLPHSTNTEANTVSRKFRTYDAFYTPTSENEHYKNLRRLVKPSL